MVNSKQKGNRGERDFSQFLREQGITGARRGQQFCGGPESPDVLGLEGMHIEVKRVEHLQLYPALEQSDTEKKSGELPIVAHRKNNQGWVVILKADDFMKLYRAWVLAPKTPTTEPI